MRSLSESLKTPVEAKVTGEIPKWLAGTLFK
jgi:hypothetical protein